MKVIAILGLILSSAILAFQVNYFSEAIGRKTVQINLDLLKKVPGILSGIAFLAISLLAFLLTQLNPAFFRLFLLLLVLVAISAIDAKWHIIPDALTVSFVVQQLLMLYAVEQNRIDWINTAVSVAVFGLLVLVSYLSKWRFGMGDVKLISVANLALGISVTLYSVAIGMFFMVLVSVPLLITKRRTLKTSVPFAPYFTAGLVVFYLLSVIA